MKTKIAYLTMALVIALSMAIGGLLIVQAPPVAASPGAVTNVWVQFKDSAYNTIDTDPIHYIHFTPTTALSRGVDTITVWYPDGTTAMGPDNFDLTDGDTTRTYYLVDRDGEASTYSAVASISAATLSTSGYRVSVVTPVDLDAGTPCYLKILAGAGITTADESSESFLDYKVKVFTSQDTTPVLSDAFPLDDAGPTTPTLTLSPDTAGLAGQWEFVFELPTQLSAGSGTVTVIFPLGTTVPGSIIADYVSFYNGSSWSVCTIEPTVNQKARTVTATTPVTLTAAAGKKIKFSTSAAIMNPATVLAANQYGDCYMYTSKDELQVVEVGTGPDVTAGTETKLGFNNDEYNSASVSDDATMIYMYSDMMYLEVWDANENLLNPDTEPVVTFTSDKSGTFYNVTGGPTYTQINTQATSSGELSISYRPASSGTHTLTLSAPNYTPDFEWTMYVAPAVELYDSSNNLINTYAPLSTATVQESTTVHSGDYVQNAINASITGDTVKLGGSSGNIAIYELDNYLSLNQKIKLTSKNGAAYTSLRPATEPLNGQVGGYSDIAIVPEISGTAANPVIIEALTFDRLVRTGGTNDEFDQGVFNNGWNYMTVTGNTFNYVIPEDQADSEWGNVVTVMVHTQLGGGGAAPITSATVSNNTFNNCCSFTTGALSSGNIHVITKVGNHKISGVTISGNTLTNSNGVGISVNGYNNTVTASITNNTITNAVIPIDIQRQTADIVVTGNTITGGYDCGIVFEGANNAIVTIKNNTITGSAGTGITIGDAPKTVGTDYFYIQYNDIYDNGTYAIYGAAAIVGTATDYLNILTQYNWYGDASGPAYTALTGATVTKSNSSGTGDPITDYIVYYPWLHTSKATVVADNASYQTSTVDLVSGWNTLSTPVELISAADTIGELIPTGRTIGYWYDAFDADADGYYWELLENSYELSPCDSVYVKLSLAKTAQLKFAANEFTTPEKALAAGWNMISLAYLTSSGLNADDAVASVAKTAAGLPGYGQVVSPSLNATQKDMYGNTGTSWAVAYGQDSVSDKMYAGLGYWIYMQNAATLAGMTITPLAPDLD